MTTIVTERRLDEAADRLGRDHDLVRSTRSRLAESLRGEPTGIPPTGNQRRP